MLSSDELTGTKEQKKQVIVNAVMNKYNDDKMVWTRNNYLRTYCKRLELTILMSSSPGILLNSNLSNTMPSDISASLADHFEQLAMAIGIFGTKADSFNVLANMTEDVDATNSAWEKWYLANRGDKTYPSSEPQMEIQSYEELAEDETNDALGAILFAIYR